MYHKANSTEEWDWERLILRNGVDVQGIVIWLFLEQKATLKPHKEADSLPNLGCSAAQEGNLTFDTQIDFSG